MTIFRFDAADRFRDRIEARSATLEDGYWRLEDVRFYASGIAPTERETFRLRTSLTPAQVGESFATPETVPFWQLSSYIDLAENAGVAAAGYRLQYYQLLAQPFYLVAMVLLAAAVSLRFFRFGGVQKVILGGIGAGFLLYVLAKIAGRLEQGWTDGAPCGGGIAAGGGGYHRPDCLALSGGRVMARPAIRFLLGTLPHLVRRVARYCDWQRRSSPARPRRRSRSREC